MDIVDVHNHLRGWSPDAGQRLEDLIEKASEHHIGGVGISDHYDADPTCYPNEKPWVFDPKAYMDTFFDARRLPSKRNPDDPPGFLVSIELGWTEAVSGELHRLLRDYPFDYGVLSLHFLEGLNPYADSEKKAVYGVSLDDVYARVVNKIADSAEDMKEARVIGHFDFFSRYAPEVRSKMCYRHAPDAFDRLFRVMHENGQILEINAGTIDALIRTKGYALQDAMPDEAILRRYRELGNRFIAFASDAHFRNHCGRYMRPAVEYAASVGLRDWAWFEAGELHYTSF